MTCFPYKIYILYVILTCMHLFIGFIKEEVIPVNSMKVTNHSSLTDNRRVSAELIAIDVHNVIADGGLCARCCCGLSQRM